MELNKINNIINRIKRAVKELEDLGIQVDYEIIIPSFTHRNNIDEWKMKDE